MKKIAVLIILFFPIPGLYASANTTLIRVDERKVNNHIVLTFLFDLTPAYTVRQSGKRIDLILKKTIVGDSALHFSPNGDIVKFLPLVDTDQASLSFFLRYQPRQAKISAGKDNSLILDIGLGESRPHTDIVSDLQRPPSNGKTSPAGNPLTLSPYAHDWRLFFHRYESRVTIKVPVQFTLPPFPLIKLLPPEMEKNLHLIPTQLNELASTGQWNAMEPQVEALLSRETDIEKKKKLALTYGEVLVRAGNFSGAYKQLYLLEHSYPKQPLHLFSGFLLARLQAEFEDPNLADYSLKELAPSLQNDSPLAPYFLLLQIETALATHQMSRMKSLLDRDDIPYPADLEKIKELRQADYWYTDGNQIKAYVRYKLLNDPNLIDDHYYSLNSYCDTLYQQKHFQEAAKCYQKLANHVTDKGQLGMVDYRKAMSELHFKSDYDMMTDFSTLADAFPDSDAGYKAAIKRNDIRFLTKKNWEAETSRSYATIAAKAVNRETSEEAAFKEALVYKLIGKNEKSIDLLMRFLRDYRSGDLIETAQALLLDLLPGELQRLIQEKKYVEALVLAKKNDMFFRKKWLDIKLLADIALAYQNLGLFSEAKDTYLYLMDIEGEKAEKRYYLPLIQALYHQGEYGSVETYATSYEHTFPDGEDAGQILLLHLQALKNENKIDQAISLLPSPLPDSHDLRRLAASIYFQHNDFEDVIRTLTPLESKDQSLPAFTRFILAESLYKQKAYDKAAEIYSTLQDTDPFQDQALFELADIALKKGQKEKAVKLLQKIVDKGKDPLWKNLAQKELEYEKIINSR